MRNLSLVFAMVLLMSASAWAQRTVSGTVMGGGEEPLPFAGVQVQGTSVGTTTDAQGKYSIAVPEGSSVLVYSYTGYITKTVELGAENVINVSLSEDVLQLETAVVTGYGTQKKKDITGAVASIDGEALADIPDVGVQTALRGRAAGVQVVQNSGTPGGGIDVRVRGSTSLSADNQPLYVIDGVPVRTGNLSQNAVGNQGTNALADLNPNDIASIEVLKDASTAAIYGARGANGVVLITTKKGKAGKTNISLSSSYGVQEAWKQIDMLDSSQYFQYLADAFDNRFGPGTGNLLGRGTGDTYWQDEVFRRGAIQDHTLSISGGDLKTRFYTSLSYFQNEGIVKGSQFDRLAARLNVDHSASDRFTVGANMSFTTSNNKRVQNDNNIYGAVSTAILLPPDVPVYNADGSYASAYGLENPLAAVTEYQNNARTDRFIGNLFAKYNLTDELFVKVSLGTDALSFREEVYEPSLLVSARGSNGFGFVGTQNVFNWINENTLNYQKTVDAHSISAVAGISFQSDVTRFGSIAATGFPGPDISTLNAGANKTVASSNYTINNLVSYFFNGNYSYDDRYIFTLTARSDGSSRFAQNNKFAFFPAASAAWRLSSEEFMADVDLFNDLKVRVGYGVTGNQNIGNFSALELFTPASYADNPGFGYNQLGNPNLRWETTTQFNAGVDFAILDNRISGSVDYYIKNTDDLLFNRPIPTTSGFTSYLENIGSMQNKGFEVSLSTLNVQTSDFSWTTTLNLAQNRNVVTELFNDQPIDAGFGSRVDVGQPVGAFFGYVTDGLFNSQDEVDAHATQPGAAPGDVRFVDINGDGVINDADRDYIGSAQPDLFGGLTNSLKYKNFTFDFFFQFSYGNEILNNNTVFAEGMNSVFNQTTRTLDAWTPDNTNTMIPRRVWGDPNNNRRDSDRFVEDGSYLRLKTATLAYDFDKAMLGASGLSRLRVYVAGQNLLTFTNYSWFDPEVNTFDGSNIALGTDFLTYPQARSIVFGLNVGF